MPTQIFLLSRNFNVFVDCALMIPTVGLNHDHCAGSPMPKLTKRIVDAIEPQPIEFFLWDEGIPGFGVRVMPSGRKSFVVQFRAGRRARRMSLGPSTVLTCDQARTRAITIIAAVKNGEDPAADRAAKRNAATVSDLADRFDKEHISVRLKASTAKEYRGNLKRFILPALGRLAVPEITRADVAKFHHDLRHIPYQANRCLEVVSKMFGLAEMWGLRPDGSNPRKHIRKYPEEKRERFLSAAELRRIGEVLREMESERIELTSAILAARLLILTGCRLGEIMALKWDHVDFEERALRLPDSKTGKKVVHVGAPAVEYLHAAQRIDGNPWVITGTLPGKPLSDLQPFWQRVRARAGVKDVRIHDLRHTFASIAVASGQGLPMIGKLLGHTQVQTTARYAHLAADPVRSAADAVATSLREALG
jgi:integrase